jgi:hypothetical protein
MREIRPSGSEGGGTNSIASPYPYLNDAPVNDAPAALDLISDKERYSAIALVPGSLHISTVFFRHFRCREIRQRITPDVMTEP